jgi:hypothetical protein
LPKDIFIIYEAGFAYINPRLFPEWFAPELIASPDSFFNYLVEYCVCSKEFQHHLHFSLLNIFLEISSSMCIFISHLNNNIFHHQKLSLQVYAVVYSPYFNKVQVYWYNIDKAKKDLIHKNESMAVIVIKYIDGQY